MEEEIFEKMRGGHGEIYTRTLACAGMRSAPEVMTWMSGSGSSRAVAGE